MRNDEESRRFREIVSEVTSIGGASYLGDFIPILRWIHFGGVQEEGGEARERCRFSFAGADRRAPR